MSALALLDGRPAQAEELAGLAFAGHAHGTYLQVRDRKARGVDLHLDRLRAASEHLYGFALDDEEVRQQLRTASDAAPADSSLLVTAFSTDGEFTPASAGARPRLLVRTALPYDGPPGPLALQTVAYRRPLPTIKHVGEIAKTYYARHARANGFDDAVFVDERGRLSEATIWNLAFWDGSTVIWPVADKLLGTTMGILRRQLTELGVPQETREVTRSDLHHLEGAVVMNSWTPGVLVTRVDDTALPEATSFVELLRQAFRCEPLVGF